MIHFEHLERAGLRLALMTDQSDGDCGSRPGTRAHVDAVLRRLPMKPERLVRVKQVHGVRIVDAQEAINAPPDGLIEADGLVTQQPGIALCVSVADCAPVLLFDPRVGAVAALHAGREGTRQNIVGAGVQALADGFAAQPASLYAVIGPCAG
ncbi:MAG TPA: laccase domain-containing protein, partial [Candidatus Hydrogenedentes bacterium]|nr:laccase domain-containing protein [Candidatus Hydrogenedentota bacterium]